jgi:hypothetical protein
MSFEHKGLVLNRLYAPGHQAGHTPSPAGSRRSAAGTREIFELFRTPGEAHSDAQQNRMAGRAWLNAK